MGITDFLVYAKDMANRAHDLVTARVSPTTALLGGAGVLGGLYLWSLRRPKGAPPGPLHIPIIGSNSLNIIGAPEDMFEGIRKQGEAYGGIYSVYVGWK